MALVSRNVLKSFFQTGDKPTQAQFDCLIDSLLHYADDRYRLGLKEYDPALAYLTGDTVVFEEDIYMALSDTTGSFNPAAWNKISPSIKFFWDQPGEDATDSVVKIAFDKNFTPLIAGLYSIEWYCELGRNASVGVTNKSQVWLNDAVVIGQSAPRIADDTEYVAFSGFFTKSFPATEQNIKIDFVRLSGSSGDVLIRNIRVRVVKN